MTNPHTYLVKLNWIEGRSGIVHVDGKPSVKVEPPIQFGGGTENWSPEDLLLASLSSCMMATFFTFTKNEAIEILSYDGVAQGSLEKANSGYSWSDLVLEVKVEVEAKYEDRVRVLLLKAKQKCIIANLLKTHVRLNFTLNGVRNEERMPQLEVATSG